MAPPDKPSNANGEGTAPAQGVLTPELIAVCYRLLLGREPESDEVLSEKLTLATVENLLTMFVRSEEYTRRIPASFQDYFMRPAADIEVAVEPPDLARMFERIRIEWSTLGEADPFWSVLTDEAFRSGVIGDEARAAFYATGAASARAIDVVAGRCGVAVAETGVCLEFGCGVGRVTTHLARRFRGVIAVDISEGNLAVCRDELERQGVDNVETVLIRSPEEVAELPHFDFLSSTIVFQHNPPPVQHYLLDTLLRKISRGGAFLFQLPTHTPGYGFRAAEYLTSPPGGMELHSLPMADVMRLLAKHRMTPLEVLMDGWTGLYGSHSFFGVKG